MDHVRCTKETEIGTLLERTAQQQADISAMRRDLRRLTDSMLGNGAPGLKQRIAEQELHIIDLAKRVAEIPSVKRLITYSTIGGAGMLLVVWLAKDVFGK